MRGIILALLLALAGSERTHIEPVFSESKASVYNYEAVILNGFPESGLSRAGIKINCKVEISAFAQRSYFIKIQSPEIKEYNGVWPKDPFTRSSKLTQALADQLTKPARFEYSYGRVGDIFVPDDVSDTAVNIYRGILNLLQLTLKKSQNVYDLQESSVGGICHTRYVIQEDRRGDRINIIKATDFNNCQEKVSKSFGFELSDFCHSCKQMNRNLRGAATYTYKLKARDQGTVIMEVTARQVIQFTPFNERNGAATMEARQVLAWVGSKSGQMNPPQIQHLIKTKSPEAQAVEVLQHLIQDTQQQIREDAPAKFLQLIQLLRASDFENIQALWKQFAQRTQYRRWLLNAIPMAGTVDCLKLIKQLIHNEELTPQEAAVIVTFAMRSARPSQRAFQFSADFVQDSKVQKYDVVYKAALLSYGTMVKKYCDQLSSCPNQALEVGFFFH
eukprot:XP_012810850.1 PREDICTED: vitellogenin-A2-like [Xenopus tropicalis]